jgi:hypothetical protein
MSSMRRLILFFVVLLAGAPTVVHANELTDWMNRQAFELDMAEPNPGSAMRQSIHYVADRGLDGRLADQSDVCGLEATPHQRAYCWTSYGRNLRIMMPELAWNVVSVLRPHTLYSYKAVDLRFPPAVRLRLPNDAFTVIGYDDEFMGWRLRIKF